MPTARIHNIRESESGDLVSGDIELGPFGCHTIYFKSSDTRLSATSSAFVSLALLPCMELGLNCEVDAGLSQRLSDSLAPIQDILTGWESRFRRIELRGRNLAVENDSNTRRVTATFFSGGVDSLYTLNKHLDDIDVLVLVHGFDMKLTDERLRAIVASRIEQFAAQTGKTLIQVETNVGEFLRRYVGWAYGHGPALAAVGHALRSSVDRLFIPATHLLADNVPWGSHPLLDPLWSDEAMEFVHDGDDTNRVEKTERVAAWPQAMQCLRVCWRNEGGAYNCGHCAKCLRTMITLKMINRESALSAFDQPINIELVSRLRLPDENSRAFAREIITDPRLQECDPELHAAVSSWLVRPPLLVRINQKLKKIRLRRTLRRMQARAFSTFS